MGICAVCKEVKQDYQLEKHHIVSRKQQPALKFCELNLIDVCIECHKTGPEAIHNAGYKNLKKLRIDLQTKYYEIFSKDFYTKEEVQELLDIKDFEVEKLLKHLTPQGISYEKEDIIRACMGGRIY